MGLVSDIFAKKTFSEQEMLRYLPKDVYRKLKKTISEGEPLDKDIASSVAHGMKEWALSQGVTHFTHWFHPMRGVTAEKHDTFLQKINLNEFIERFSPSELIQGETDASSFPSGGVRTTFEARGYTAWDPTSPAFIIDDTLCIPSVYFSYNGEPLDKKMPLIKSTELVENEAFRLLKLFGNRTAKSTRCTIGAEQEYFLITEEHLKNRPDLALCDRTLIGSPSPKGQLMENHYFGSIKERVLAFMRDLENSLLELGIPLKTRHNEVAPNQFEFAPIYETANIASDHNAISLEMIKKVAKRHKLAAILHEKPFTGINGSGKHINWSLEDSDGKNLLQMGKTKKKKMQFLTFLTGCLIGVAKYEKILKLSSLSYSNEIRLGGNEAPPTILSSFIGDMLQNLLDMITNTKNITELPDKLLSVGLPKIPTVKIDYSDRNRTSPFAYTGNKFEFRMPGSSYSVSEVVAFMNTVIFHGIKEMTDLIEKELTTQTDFEKALFSSLQKAQKSINRIIYNGDCYDNSWLKEAKKRKLSTSSTYFEMLEEITKNEMAECLVKPGVFSKSYLKAMIEIKKSHYLKTMEVECNVLSDMIKTAIIPAGIKQLEQYENLHRMLTDLKLNNSKNSIYSNYAATLNDLHFSITTFEEETANFKNLNMAEKIPKIDDIKRMMLKLRKSCDKLETMTDTSIWPFPKYSKILFDL